MQHILLAGFHAQLEGSQEWELGLCTMFLASHKVQEYTVAPVSFAVPSSAESS